MPQMGLAHPFLLAGIQAISALHLATLVPHRKQELQRLAVAQELAALPTFRASMNNPTSESVNAIFAFAGSIVYYIMASPEQYLGHRTRIPSKHDDHPHWFQTMRGLMALLINHWPELIKGPFRELLDTLPPDSHRFLRPPGDEQFVKLEGMFSPILPAEDAQKIQICRDALTELRKTSAVSYAPSGIRSIKSSIHMWVGNVSQDYIELVYERDPRALVILAHFCVLLKRNHHVWYLRGLGTGLLENIRNALSEEWRPWIQWALEQPVSEEDADNVVAS